MPVYPKQIQDVLKGLRHAGGDGPIDARGTDANFECGSFIRFQLRIDAESKSIEEVRFASNGCGYMLATAELFASRLEGVALADLNGLGEVGRVGAVEESLGEFPAERRSCLTACRQAVEAAFVDFRSRMIEEFSGDSPLICSCFGVTEERINEVIASEGATSVEDVTRACNAGGGCGSCRMLIQEFIDAV